MEQKHFHSENLKDDTKPFYVLEFPSGLPFFFEKMKEVKEFLNSEFYQDLVMSEYGEPELIYFRTGDFQGCRLDYDKWIKKD